MTHNVIALWAEDEKHLIGACGKLPWHLPKELKHFIPHTHVGVLGEPPLLGARFLHYGGRRRGTGLGENGVGDARHDFCSSVMVASL